VQVSIRCEKTFVDDGSSGKQHRSASLIISGSVVLGRDARRNRVATFIKVALGSPNMAFRHGVRGAGTRVKQAVAQCTHIADRKFREGSWKHTMDAKEVLGYLFAAIALALLMVGIWAISYYAPARSYERELRRERRARHRRRKLEDRGSSDG
jgi:dTDP-4-dehydrorhamnose reductase